MISRFLDVTGWEDDDAINCKEEFQRRRQLRFDNPEFIFRRVESEVAD